MRRDAHTSVMPPSSDVIGMETVLTSPKYVTRIWIAGMEVMSSTALTPVMFVGLKGNIFMLSASYQAHEAQFSSFLNSLSLNTSEMSLSLVLVFTSTLQVSMFGWFLRWAD